MHIPAGRTIDQEILDFHAAWALAQEEQSSYDRKKWLYVPPFYSEYRYVLGTGGNHPLICIGINPSTAAPDALDNTLKSVQRIAHANGFDSFLMFNVYAQRATSPDDMEREVNPVLHEQNMKAFAHLLTLSGGQKPSVWAAWGNLIEKRAYLPGCVLDMIALGKAHGASWYTAGNRSKKGHPHHPLYLKADSALDPFDVEAYIGGLR